MRWPDRPAEIIRPGGNYLSKAAQHASRLHVGHPEAFFEAFANIYKNVALTINARLEDRKPTAEESDFPTVDDGLRGMLFLETVVKSAKSSTKWVKFSK